MKRSGSAGQLLRLLHDLKNQDEAHRETVAANELEPAMQRLRLWQANRLAHTYADLLADPQYSAACRFFLNDIYGPRDFSQRDNDAERLQEILARYLPESMLRLLNDAVKLNRLSRDLDERLLEALGEDCEAAEEITPKSYAQGYRRCNNHKERKDQIDLLVQVLSEAALGARSPVFAISLRLAGLPARQLGWEELYDFLLRGYRACKPMRTIEPFVGVIQRREIEILEIIYSENWRQTIDEHLNP